MSFFFFSKICQCMQDSPVSDDSKGSVHRIHTHSMHDVHTVCSQSRTDTGCVLMAQDV